MGKRERQREKKRKRTVEKTRTQKQAKFQALRGSGRHGMPSHSPGTDNGRKAKRAQAGLQSQVPSPAPGRRRVSYAGAAPPSVLVIGDGDFSFSSGLLAHRGGNPARILATAYDSKEQVVEKYPTTAIRCLEALGKVKASLAFQVDATKLRQTLPKDHRDQVWDRVVWNFPHSGKQRTHENRALLQRFLASAKGLLAPRGQVHITLKLTPPYDRWDLEGVVAEGTGMALADRVPFDFSVFPGYRHRTTLHDAKHLFKQKGGAAKDRERRNCFTFIFVATTPVRRESLLNSRVVATCVDQSSPSPTRHGLGERRKRPGPCDSSNDAGTSSIKPLLLAASQIGTAHNGGVQVDGLRGGTSERKSTLQGAAEDGSLGSMKTEAAKAKTKSKSRKKRKKGPGDGPRLGLEGKSLKLR